MRRERTGTPSGPDPAAALPALAGLDALTTPPPDDRTTATPVRPARTSATPVEPGPPARRPTDETVVRPGGTSATSTGSDRAAPRDLGAAAGRLLRAGLPVLPAARLAAGLAIRPLAVGRRGWALATDLARLGSGGPDRSAAEAVHRAATGLLQDAELGGADHQRLRATLDALHTLLDRIVDGTAPPPRPEQLPQRRPESRPAPVIARPAGTRPDPAAHRPAARPDAGWQPVPPAPHHPGTPGAGPELGTDIAASPGAVVLRTAFLELIHYLPRTETVRAVPVLVVPPLANRHYLVDLVPRCSLVRHLVEAGQQVFALSWRNPGPADADRTLDSYVQEVSRAMDACRRISRSPATSLLAVGSGGTVAVALLGHLAAVGDGDHAASLTQFLPVLGPTGPAAAGHSAGDLPGEPAAALRHWAGDALRVPPRLRAELHELAARDAFAQAGAVRVLGTPIDPTKVELDRYLVAGTGGRWQAAYRDARLLGGDCRFVLATGGPVTALLAPPRRTPGGYRVGRAGVSDARRWPGTAVAAAGSWWTDHLDWLSTRSGARVDAPPELGGRGLHPVAPTPGAYALSR